MFEQHARVARVFRRDKIDMFQYFERAQRDVAQISDRRRDDVEHRQSSGRNPFRAISFAHLQKKARCIKPPCRFETI
jgi:hypothetical protein